MFNWFVRTLRPAEERAGEGPDLAALLPVYGAGLLLAGARLSRRTGLRRRRTLAIRAARDWPRPVCSGSIARPGRGDADADRRRDRRRMAGRKRTGHRLALRRAAARRRPGDRRRRSLPRGSPAGLLSDAGGAPDLDPRAAAFLDQPRILLQLGNHHAFLLLPDREGQRRRAACSDFPAVLAGLRVLPAGRFRRHRSALRHDQPFGARRQRAGRNDRLRAARDGLSGQGRRRRRACLAAGRLCRGG